MTQARMKYRVIDIQKNKGSVKIIGTNEMVTHHFGQCVAPPHARFPQPKKETKHNLKNL